MSDPVGSPGRIQTYSSGFRRTLSFGALATALLPVPVLYFQLLPGYSIQTKFLVFYAPLVCFLTLAYLFYVRDALARAMFSDLLDPSPAPDPYYKEPVSASLRRVGRRFRTLILAVLPVFLLLTSSYCAVEYIRRVNQSIGQAVEQKRNDPQAKPSGALIDSGPGASGQKAKGRPTRRTRIRPTPMEPAAPIQSSDSLRQLVLRTARTEDIPSFTQLNVLFIGIFLSAEIAFILMALKEYAKEAIGLTERDLMLGSTATAPR